MVNVARFPQLSWIRVWHHSALQKANLSTNRNNSRVVSAFDLALERTTEEVLTELLK